MATSVGRLAKKALVAFLVVLLEGCGNGHCSNSDETPSRSIKSEPPASASTAVQNVSVTLVPSVGFRYGVASLSWSPDGSRLVAGGGDAAAKMWDFATGALLRTLVPREERLPDSVMRNSIAAVAFVGDGSEILVARSDGVQLWNSRSVTSGAPAELATESISAIAVTQSGDLFALAGEGTTRYPTFLRLYNSRTQKQVRDFATDGMYSINALAFDRRGELLAVGGSRNGTNSGKPGEVRGMVDVWNLCSGAKLTSFIGAVEGIDWLAFSPDGREIYTRSTGTVTQHVLPTGQALKTYTGFGASLSADGETLALSVVTAPAEESPFAAQLLKPGSAEVVEKIPWPKPENVYVRDNVLSLAFDPSGRNLAIGFSSGRIADWDLRRHRYERVWESRTEDSSIRTDQNGMGLVVSDPDFAYEWNLTTGTRVALRGRDHEPISAIAVSPRGSSVAVGGSDGWVRIWDANGAHVKASFGSSMGQVVALEFSMDEQRLLVAGRFSAGIWKVDESPVSQTTPDTTGMVSAAAFLPGDKQFAVGNEVGEVNVFEAATGGLSRRLPLPEADGLVSAMAVNRRRGKILVVHGAKESPPVVYDIRAGGVDVLPPQRWPAWSSALDPGANLAAIGSSDGTVSLWDLSLGKAIGQFPHASTVSATAFVAQGRELASFAEGSVYLRPVGSASQMLRIFNLPGGRWAVVDQNGRFDYGDLESGQDLNWVMSDDPLRPLPLGLFMRDYYEPGLLRRWVACTSVEDSDGGACQRYFKEPPPVAQLNRVEPRVEILSVQRGVSANVALVRVSVAGRTDSSQKNGKYLTGAYDLRLFRNGQLVGQWPNPAQGSGGGENLEAWRHANAIEATRDGHTVVTHDFPVRLATADSGKPVVFTAYAFNEDRVKSQAATDADFKVPGDIVRRPARAYVVSIGVNDYHSANHDLEFAVKDAQVIGEALAKIKDHQVVQITLVSDRAHDGVGAVSQATKANIHAVFDVLAGKVNAPQQRERLRVAGIDSESIAKLDPVTPDDAVIITYSGHGYTGPTGTFYLLPSDSWAGEAITGDSLPRFISSDDLVEWLRDVDAGEMGIIIDACHSAASVEVPGFKPGPMGDRSLGQLAYDKGMSILAATQSDDVALEIRDLKEGLLTYALVEDGLTRDRTGKLPANPDRTGEVSLSGWLKYGEQRTPGLYEAALKHQVKMRPRDSKIDPTFLPAFIAAQQKRAQTPVLFNFRKNGERVFLKE